MTRTLFALLAVAAFVRGDEPLPKPAPADPVPAAELDAAIQKGVAFLVHCQNDDGSFGGPEKTKGLNIMASPPGSHHAFQMATTALALAALIDTGSDAAGVRSAIGRGEEYVFERLPRLKRATPMELYNVWGATATPFKRSCACTGDCPTTRLVGRRSRS